MLLADSGIKVEVQAFDEDIRTGTVMSAAFSDDRGYCLLIRYDDDGSLMEVQLSDAGTAIRVTSMSTTGSVHDKPPPDGWRTKIEELCSLDIAKSKKRSDIEEFSNLLLDFMGWLQYGMHVSELPVWDVSPDAGRNLFAERHPNDSWEALNDFQKANWQALAIKMTAASRAARAAVK